MKNFDNTKKDPWKWPIEIDIGNEVGRFCRDVLKKELRAEIVGDGSWVVVGGKQQAKLLGKPALVIELFGPISGTDTGERLAVFKLEDILKSAISDLEKEREFCVSHYDNCQCDGAEGRMAKLAELLEKYAPIFREASATHRPLATVLTE